MQKKFLKRFLISIVLWILFWFVCTWLASSSNPGIWWSALMWNLLFNRFLIGLVIAMMWVYTIHPVLWFKCFALRGAFFWAVISLDIAIGSYISNTADPATQFRVFWMTILAWAIYGLIIDIVATKFSGQGKELLHKKQK
jgi:hypothetical protein